MPNFSYTRIVGAHAKKNDRQIGNINTYRHRQSKPDKDYDEEQ